MWRIPDIPQARLQGVTDETYDQLTSALKGKDDRELTRTIAKVESEQTIDLQQASTTLKKDARKIESIVSGLKQDNERRRESSTSSSADKPPSLPLSLNSTRRPEHVEAALASIEARFPHNLQRMDLLFQLIDTEVKEKVIAWGSPQGVGTECFDVTLARVPLFDHWAHALHLLHDTVEVEQDRVDKIYAALQRLLTLHKASDFKEITTYLKALNAAYSQATSEPALRQRVANSDWAMTRSFVEQALEGRPNKLPQTVWHAHICCVVRDRYQKLLQDDARRRSSESSARQFISTTVAPPRGFPTLKHLINLCNNELTAESRQSHMNRMQALGVNSQVIVEAKTPVEPKPRGRTSDKRSSQRSRSSSRSNSRGRHDRRHGGQETVAAAAARLRIPVERATAFEERFVVAGLALQDRPAIACYGCGSTDHLIAKRPKKIDGVSARKAFSCFRCSHPKYKVAEEQRHHPFHECPAKPRQTAGSKEPWCFECKGAHTIPNCPTLKKSPAALEEWLKILRPLRFNKSGKGDHSSSKHRAPFRNIAAFQLKHAAIGTACVKGPGYKIPRGSALKKLVARFDPDPDEDTGTTATTPPDADSSSSGEEE